MRRITTIFVTCERLARIASNLRFAIFAPPSAIRKKGVQFGNPPVLPFLVFLEKGMENHQKTRIFYPTEPLKSLEKKGKTFKKQGIPRRGKKQGIPKKTRKGRTGPETIRENQVFRANRFADSRESGHLSSGFLVSLLVT